MHSGLSVSKRVYILECRELHVEKECRRGQYVCMLFYVFLYFICMLVLMRFSVPLCTSKNAFMCVWLCAHAFG